MLLLFNFCMKFRSIKSASFFVQLAMQTLFCWEHFSIKLHITYRFWAISCPYHIHLQGTQTIVAIILSPTLFHNVCYIYTHILSSTSRLVQGRNGLLSILTECQSNHHRIDIELYLVTQYKSHCFHTCLYQEDKQLY